MAIAIKQYVIHRVNRVGMIKSHFDDTQSSSMENPCAQIKKNKEINCFFSTSSVHNCSPGGVRVQK